MRVIVFHYYRHHSRRKSTKRKSKIHSLFRRYTSLMPRTECSFTDLTSRETNNRSDGPKLSQFDRRSLMEARLSFQEISGEPLAAQSAVKRCWIWHRHR